MSFEFRELDLPGLVLIVPRVHEDLRGFFLESYKSSDFNAHGIRKSFVQDNHSCSSRGVLRGLHFQRSPRAQAKLVRVVHGAVWDVAVDLRVSSRTRYQWCAVTLDCSEHAMLYIPEGFAHGFCTIENDTHLVYKCTEEYDASAEVGIRWDDPRIGIAWPIRDPVVSERDRNLPFHDAVGEVFLT